MLTNRREDARIAALPVVPFLAVYLLVFVWPTIQMFLVSFTDAPLIGSGAWVGLDNHARLDSAPRFRTAARVVLLTVLPGTIVALLISLGVPRLTGRLQSAVLALFFLPHILPVSVVYLVWDRVLNVRFGILMHVFDLVGFERMPITRSRTWFMPAVGIVTIWWTAGFSILLVLAGLRAIPAEDCGAAVMDSASEFAILFKVFLPMNWGVPTALSIVTFIRTWSAFLWPFLSVTRTGMMTVPVGITQVNDAFGVCCARELAAAVPAGPPVAVA
jgi:multiple sugar transport system permease protein